VGGYEPVTLPTGKSTLHELAGLMKALPDWAEVQAATSALYKARALRYLGPGGAEAYMLAAARHIVLTVLGWARKCTPHERDCPSRLSEGCVEPGQWRLMHVLRLPPLQPWAARRPCASAWSPWAGSCWTRTRRTQLPGKRPRCACAAWTAVHVPVVHVLCAWMRLSFPHCSPQAASSGQASACDSGGRNGSRDGSRSSGRGRDGGSAPGGGCPEDVRGSLSFCRWRACTYLTPAKLTAAPALGAQDLRQGRRLPRRYCWPGLGWSSSSGEQVESRRPLLA
jgi:hypothetical protein